MPCADEVRSLAVEQDSGELCTLDVLSSLAQLVCEVPT